MLREELRQYKLTANIFRPGFQSTLLFLAALFLLSIPSGKKETQHSAGKERERASAKTDGYILQPGY